mmetsp:Transcript_21961/g.38669  ORF Transcript_21961/g.38669 Transcript_21961/m.38669 type:complete len:126 (+) Transcript_21961:1-378(+)
MECSAYAYGGFDGNVPDLQNVLYCDPMDMDRDLSGTGASDDDEFVIFEYNILKRYDMLDHMPNDVRNKALSLLEGQDAGETFIHHGDWHNVGLQVPNNTVVDHYGRSYFSPDMSSTQTTPSGKKY